MQIRTKLSILALTLLALTSTISCNKNTTTDDLKYSYVTTIIQGEPSVPFYFITDNGVLMFPTNAQEVIKASFTPVEGQRAIVYFTEAETGPAVSSSKQYIYGYIMQIDELLTKDMLTTTQADTLQQDYVEVKNLWFTNNLTPNGQYLNIQFEYPGSGTITHFINLCYNPTLEWKGDYCELLLTHDANLDFKSFLFTGLASFRIPTELRPESGCKGLIVKYENGDLMPGEVTITY